MFIKQPAILGVGAAAASRRGVACFATRYADASREAAGVKTGRDPIRSARSVGRATALLFVALGAFLWLGGSGVEGMFAFVVGPILSYIGIILLAGGLVVLALTASVGRGKNKPR